MSTEPGKTSSLLASFADEYELTDQDVDRLIARIHASLAQEPTSCSPSSPVGARAGSSGGKKLALIGTSCLALAIIAGAVALRAGSGADVTLSQMSAPPPIVVEPNERVREPEVTSTIPSISVEALPSVAPSRPSGNDAKKPMAATSSSEGEPTLGSTDALAHETRLIAGARGALKSGDGNRALSLLDEHAHLFPNGWLANDRAAEHIVVLCSLGRRAEAVHEAKAFLDGRPKSPLTRRVETSCAGEPSTRAEE